MSSVAEVDEAVSEDNGKKIAYKKLQVWVSQDTLVRIEQRERVTGKRTSAWIRGAIERALDEAEGRRVREDDVLSKLERMLKQYFKG